MSLIEDLDCYHDELAAEGWHNAAKGCADAIDEIERLRSENDILVERLRTECETLTTMVHRLQAEVERLALIAGF